MSQFKAEYFLGGISPDGFMTHFGKEISDEKNFTYILKGGAGTGKSSLMKQLVEKFGEKDNITVYHCASDPKSIDAIKLNSAKIIMVDGTAPHVFDPIFPGVKQKIINLGDFWCRSKLEVNSEKIISASKECNRWHKRCKSFVNALSSLNSDTYMISQESLDYEKLEAYISRLSRKIFSKGKAKDGETNFSQLSALTPNGYMTFLGTIEGYESTYIMNDFGYSGSDFFLRELATVAVSKGYDVIISECTLFNSKTYEHLLIPEISTAFINSNPINSIELASEKQINFKRFYDKTFLYHKKQRLSFNKKAGQDLLDEAANALKNAIVVHDELESYYISAMDFDGINSLAEKIVDEINAEY